MGFPLVTLESQTPLKSHGCSGILLSYELNVNECPEYAVPGRHTASGRRERVRPIVIGGGPLMLNPKPFEKFFDVIVVGEADEVLMEMLDILEASRGMRKSEIVKALADLEVSIPLFPKERVKRLFVGDLDKSYHPNMSPDPNSGEYP